MPITENRIIPNHDSEANWALQMTFVPFNGEIIIYDADDRYPYPRIKIGDGVTTVSLLPFATSEAFYTTDNKNKLDLLPFTYYATCATAKNDPNKIVLIDNRVWQLRVGAIIGVRFTNTNIATNCTLNVNNTGAKYIYYSSAVYIDNDPKVCGYADRINYYMYDGTYWCWLNTGSTIFDISSVQGLQEALDTKAPIKSPEFTGLPLAPTAPIGTSNLQIANTEFVNRTVSELVNSAPEVLDTLDELAAALGNDPNFSTTILGKIGEKASQSDFNTHISDSILHITAAERTKWNDVDNRVPNIRKINGYTLTSDIDLTAADVGATTEEQVSTFIGQHDNSGLAHESIRNSVALKYTKPELGIPKADLDSDIQVSLSKADSAIQNLNVNVQLESPQFTGIPTAPTAEYTSNDTQIANTAFVKREVSNLVGTAPEALDTLQELSTALGNDPNFSTTILQKIGEKVDKVTGKGLSTNDYTTEEKNKLASIADNANNYIHPSHTSRANGIYKLTVDNQGHISNAALATKEDISALSGIGAEATISSQGLMSAADKAKLDGIAQGANKYIHPDSSITSGSYFKTTYDKYGHAISGENPTTLAGFGIIDAAKNVHEHIIGDISGLAVTADELNFSIGLTNNIQTQLDEKSNDFPVNFTFNVGNNLTCNKTINEIYEAINANKNVYGLLLVGTQLILLNPTTRVFENSNNIFVRFASVVHSNFINIIDCQRIDGQDSFEYIEDSIPNSAITQDGLMSKEDKVLINGVTSNIQEQFNDRQIDFIINATIQSNGSIVCDKTVQEIIDAVDDITKNCYAVITYADGVLSSGTEIKYVLNNIVKQVYPGEVSTIAIFFSALTSPNSIYILSIFRQGNVDTIKLQIQNIPIASVTEDGLMSNEDKAAFDASIGMTPEETRQKLNISTPPVLDDAGILRFAYQPMAPIETKDEVNY